MVASAPCLCSASVFLVLHGIADLECERVMPKKHARSAVVGKLSVWSRSQHPAVCLSNIRGHLPWLYHFLARTEFALLQWNIAFLPSHFNAPCETAGFVRRRDCFEKTFTAATNGRAKEATHNILECSSRPPPHQHLLVGMTGIQVISREISCFSARRSLLITKVECVASTMREMPSSSILCTMAWQWLLDRMIGLRFGVLQPK